MTIDLEGDWRLRRGIKVHDPVEPEPDEPVVDDCDINRHVYCNVSTEPGRIIWQCRRCNWVKP